MNTIKKIERAYSFSRVDTIDDIEEYLFIDGDIGIIQLSKTKCVAG